MNNRITHVDYACNQFDCDNKPEIIVYWPGKNPPPKYCKYHAERAVSILNIMGIPANVRRIDDI